MYNNPLRSLHGSVQDCCLVVAALLQSVNGLNVQTTFGCDPWVFMCCYNLLSVSGEFYIFIHMLKCYVFRFSWEINNSRIYILMAAAGGKHPWSCLFYQLSLFFLSLERCGNFVSTRKGHLNTSKGSFLPVLWQYRHHEFDMSNIE